MDHFSWVFSLLFTLIWLFAIVRGVSRMIARARGGMVTTVTPARPLDSGEEIVLRGMVSQGQKIEALRYYREKTGAGLKEAKDYVERLARG